MGKLIKIYALVCVSLFALWLTFTILSENNQLEANEQWWEYNECYADQFTYRIFGQKGKWYVDVKNNTEADMFIDFEVGNGIDSERHSAIIKSGESTEPIQSSLKYAEDGPDFTVVEVSNNRYGRTEKLECR